jgi:nuclear mRNA export protein PCID2/THP1
MNELLSRISRAAAQADGACRAVAGRTSAGRRVASHGADPPSSKHAHPPSSPPANHARLQNTGQRLKHLLRLDPHVNPLTRQAVAPLPSPQAARQAADGAARSLPEGWPPVVAGHFAAARTAFGSDDDPGSGADAAYRLYTAPDGPALALLDVLRDRPDDAWLGAAFEALLLNVRWLAEQADDAARRQGRLGGGAGGAGDDDGAASAANASSKVEALGGFLQNAFSHLGAPKGRTGQEGRRRAGLAIMVALIKAYFRLNNVSGCAQASRTVQGVLAARDPALRGFPAGHRVAYHYYMGRIAIFTERFAEAGEHLGAAYAGLAPRGSAEGARHARHRRQVLRFLVPVRMLLGELPPEGLLQAADAEGGGAGGGGGGAGGGTEGAPPAAGSLERDYGAVAASLRAGDVGGLRRALAASRLRYARSGTYLLLERLQLPCLRRLFHRAHGAWARAVCAAAGGVPPPPTGGGQQPLPPRANQLPVALLVSALEAQGAFDEEDAEEEALLREEVVTEAMAAAAGGAGGAAGEEAAAAAAAAATPLPAEALSARQRQRREDSVMCALANLIARDYVRGYIAYRSKVLVLSKQNPFPGFSERWLADVV